LHLHLLLYRRVLYPVVGRRCNDSQPTLIGIHSIQIVVIDDLIFDVKAGQDPFRIVNGECVTAVLCERACMN